MPDRAMTVDVIIGGRQNDDGTFSPPNMTRTFALANTTPIVTPTGTIVAADGAIDLNNFPSAEGYTQNVDITFRISGVVNSKVGGLLGARWATALEGDGRNVGYGWFTESEDADAKTITIPGMSFSQVNLVDHKIVLEDDLDNNSAYYYSLGFVLEWIATQRRPPQPARVEMHYLVIDPKIVTPPPIGQ